MSAVVTDLNRRAVTLEEASEMLALSEMTLRRAIRSGRLQAFRFGTKGAYRIPLEAIEDFIKNSYTTAEPIENNGTMV